MLRMLKSGILVLVLVISLTMSPTALAQEVTPSVTVSDQAIVDGAVTVAQVVSDGPGWIVIHAEGQDEHGHAHSHGHVLGYTQVEHGMNDNVRVEVDPTMATPTLYAMLHADTGELGVHEHEGADPVVVVEGREVTQPFQLLALLPETGASLLPWIGVTVFISGLAFLSTAIFLSHRRATQAVQSEE